MKPVRIEIDSVFKSFGNHLALDDVSLKVAEGEFFSILGPSGCGKSTLLRLIAGLDDHDRGDIRIGGASMTHVSPKDRGVAFVFQSYALYPHLSSYENIAAPLVMRELSAFERLPLARRVVPAVRRKLKTIDARVNAIAGLLKVESFLDRKPAQLSGGQRQRIALGRALVREPNLFLLDEPFANLDAALRNHTRSELSGIQKRIGTTTIFVTHDQGEALAMSDRIAVMFDGVVRQVGTPDELYRKPGDLDVARFFSQPYLNAFAARTIVSGWVSICGAHIAVATADKPGENGIVAFRPEHCSLSMVRGAGMLSGTVERVEHAGADGHVFVRLDADSDPCAVRVASHELGQWPTGTVCFVALAPDTAWFFKDQDHVSRLGSARLAAA
jgi:multiple sugar transport system ATP-binding protein